MKAFQPAKNAKEVKAERLNYPYGCVVERAAAYAQH
jgi:hypothetical protein